MSSAIPSLPDAFTQRLTEILPAEDLARVTDALHTPESTIFRINRLQADDGLLGQLAADGFSPLPLPWFDGLYRVPDDQRRALTEHPAFTDGAIYIQNPSSLMPVLALDPQPGEEVMDMCAAPGGKTLYLAERMHNRGRIAAVEAVRGRFFKLKAMMQAYGAGIVQCYHADARHLWRKVPERFDRILLDAPCSSESRINALDADSWRFWSLKKHREMSRKQQGLIRSAFDCLKPDGVMVYCTCTYAPEENEMVVQSLLDLHGDRVAIEAIELPCPHQMAGLSEWRGKMLHPDLAKAVRILPDTLQSSFFLCKIRKQAYYHPTDIAPT